MGWEEITKGSHRIGREFDSHVFHSEIYRRLRDAFVTKVLKKEPSPLFLIKLRNKEFHSGFTLEGCRLSTCVSGSTPESICFTFTIDSAHYSVNLMDIEAYQCFESVTRRPDKEMTEFERSIIEQLEKPPLLSPPTT